MCHDDDKDKFFDIAPIIDIGRPLPAFIRKLEVTTWNFFFGLFHCGFVVDLIWFGLHLNVFQDFSFGGGCVVIWWWQLLLVVVDVEGGCRSTHFL